MFYNLWLLWQWWYAFFWSPFGNVLTIFSLTDDGASNSGKIPSLDPSPPEGKPVHTKGSFHKVPNIVVQSPDSTPPTGLNSRRSVETGNTDVHVPVGELTGSSPGGSINGGENELNPRDVEENSVRMAGSSHTGSTIDVRSLDSIAPTSVRLRQRVETGNTDVHVPVGGQTGSSPGGNSNGGENELNPQSVEEGVKPHVLSPAGEQPASGSGGSSDDDEHKREPKGVEEGVEHHVPPPAGEQTASSSVDSSGRVAEVVQSGGDQNNPQPRGVEEGVTFHVPPPVGEQAANGFGSSGESDAEDTEVVADAAQSDAERQPAGLLTRTGNDEEGAFGGNDEYDSFVAGGQNATDMAQSGLRRSSPTPRR